MQLSKDYDNDDDNDPNDSKLFIMTDYAEHVFLQELKFLRLPSDYGHTGIYLFSQIP